MVTLNKRLILEDEQTSISHASNITLKHLSEYEFANMSGEWKMLLACSDADPFFLCWEWQYTWWQQWAEKENFELFLIAAYTETNKLVGLAPLYKCKKHLAGSVKIAQLHFIGSSWGLITTVRTEYLDFIVDKKYSSQVRNKFLSHLEKDKSWDQFIISDINADSPTYRLISSKRYFTNDYCREVQRDMGVYVETGNLTFEEFVAELGRHTRRSVFNRRSYLKGLGEFEYEYASQDNIDDYFKKLNRLHFIRWKKNCFSGDVLAFHQKLAHSLCVGGKLKFSKITVSKQPISVLYNYLIDNKEYNIQAGFNDIFSEKISLGYIHLGYAIESAFRNENTKAFDLLAGSGKNSFYKSHFIGKFIELLTLQINRGSFIKSIYRGHDIMPDYVRGMTKRTLNAVKLLRK